MMGQTGRKLLAGQLRPGQVPGCPADRVRTSQLRPADARLPNGAGQEAKRLPS